MLKKILIWIAIVVVAYILVAFLQLVDKPKQQDIIEKLYLEKSKSIIEKKQILQQKQIIDKKLWELNTAIEEIDNKIKTEINSGLDFQ